VIVENEKAALRFGGYCLISSSLFRNIKLIIYRTGQYFGAEEPIASREEYHGTKRIINVRHDLHRDVRKAMNDIWMS
jgi:hypothetical protein